jgi:hypothetical protein
MARIRTINARQPSREALAQFDDMQTALRDERLQCLKTGASTRWQAAQWEGPLWDQYENKPKFEVNKIMLAVIGWSTNTATTASRWTSCPKTARNDKLAEVCDGLYRADEQASVADEAYDNAFEEAVGGGIGAWRLRTVYEDDEDPEDDRQRIRIEPISSTLTVRCSLTWCQTPGQVRRQVLLCCHIDDAPGIQRNLG